MTIRETCPRCGAELTPTTTGYICQRCGYRYPAQVSVASGTGAIEYKHPSYLPRFEMVNVVRCKDCRFFHQSGEWGICDVWDGHTVPVTGYCFEALERKETRIMRLIDADELIANLKKDPLFGLVEQYGISRVIEAQATVDAVPIEWIKMRIKGLRGQLVNADEDDKDLIWDLRTKIDELSYIAEYWRKKHETD